MARRRHGRGMMMMDEFINSKAMITPGVAGTSVIMVTGSLVSQFDIPGNWVALILSFLLGMAVWSDDSVVMPNKLVLYVLNSLIIFTVANGINAAALEAAHAPKLDRIERALEADTEKPAFFRRWTW